MKKAFTLAEILIVLMIIGVLTAILLPVAFQSAPDENVMKFKKAHSTLATVLRELTASTRYYANGDLGQKAAVGDANPTPLIPKDQTGGSEANHTYFCESLADIMSYKEKDCKTSGSGDGFVTVNVDSASISSAKSKVDTECSEVAETAKEIITPDNVVWYQVRPETTFGRFETGTTSRRFSDPNGSVNYPDDFGFDSKYKIFCIDIDGIGTGEAPFGYGIRADGKLLVGARAEEWQNKTIQKGND